jgi:hypothetical protein
VYLESSVEGQLTNRSCEVSLVTSRYDAIRADALPARTSIGLITKVMEEKWTHS